MYKPRKQVVAGAKFLTVVEKLKAMGLSENQIAISSGIDRSAIHAARYYKRDVSVETAQKLKTFARSVL